MPKPYSGQETSSIVYITNNPLTEIRDLEIEDVQVLSHSKNVEDRSDKHLKALRPSQSLTILDFYIANNVWSQTGDFHTILFLTIEG